MQTLTADVRSVSEQISDFGDSYPKSIALKSGTRVLSYEELDRLTNQFAGYLTRSGLLPGGTAAICMERSFDWIIAALAIMRTGAAYVPLDPAWPDSRLQFAITDSGASILVGRNALLGRLNLSIPSVDPERDASAIASSSSVSPHTILPEDVAYVIYTSGSTGVPKGVEITHANLAHLIRWHREAFKIDAKDRCSHLAGLGFDAAVWEIWPALSTGATLCLASDEVRSSPELLQQWMISEGVTVGFVPTVHAGPLVRMEWPSSTALRFLLTGGDKLHRPPLKGLPFEVVNNYGPTECTVVATSGVIKAGSADVPSIGRAIKGTVVYLLDEHLHPVAAGEAGEIVIGGTGVGRGYRNLPELTEQFFVPDPFSGVAGARMYRSGDLGSLRTDGEIEFRGRRDRQTKIRGQRVELDEIDSVLATHASVAFAVATIVTTDSGESQLAAYVLPKENATIPTATELQEHVKGSLPDYMIPSMFARLKSLPLSANGKLDLKLLPSIKTAEQLPKLASVAPASATEAKLLTIVRDILESPTVGPEDNFFLAGGHSLLGMQLVTRLRKAFSVDLSLHQLFQAPNVKRLAVIVENLQQTQQLTRIWEDLLDRKQIGQDQNFFEIGGNGALAQALKERIASEFNKHLSVENLSEKPTIRQQAELIRKHVGVETELPEGVLALLPKAASRSIFWVHYHNVNLAKAIGDDQSFLSVGLTPQDLHALGKSPTLQAIAARLVPKIVATQAKGPYTIGGLCVGGILSYEVASQLQSAGHKVNLLVLVDPPNPSYLDVLPKFDLTYVRYIAKRARKLGPRISLMYLYEHVTKRLVRMTTRKKEPLSDVSIAQEMIESAAFVYRPTRYDGKVLLLLASERPPSVDFLPGWQAVVPNHLYTEYMAGHHRDLLAVNNARNVADAIMFHLTDTTEQVKAS